MVDITSNQGDHCLHIWCTLDFGVVILFALALGLLIWGASLLVYGPAISDFLGKARVRAGRIHSQTPEFARSRLVMARVSGVWIFVLGVVVFALAIAKSRR